MSATALTVVGILGLAACNTPPEPSNLETPAVVWPSGDPFGDFADDPAVQAEYYWLVNESIAWNVLDYSDPDLVNSVGLARAQASADHLQSERRYEDFDGLTEMGPEPYFILDVITHQEHSTVVSCAYGDRNNADSRHVFYDTVTFSADGTARLEPETGPPSDAKTAEEYRAECRVSDIPVGYFDPAPVPNMDRGAKVKGPADASKYDLE